MKVKGFKKQHSSHHTILVWNSVKAFL